MIEADRIDCGTRTTTSVVSAALITRVSKERPLSRFTRFTLDYALAASAQPERKGGERSQSGSSNQESGIIACHRRRRQLTQCTHHERWMASKTFEGDGCFAIQRIWFYLLNEVQLPN
jgi:hypothetical protein